MSDNDNYSSKNEKYQKQYTNANQFNNDLKPNQNMGNTT